MQKLNVGVLGCGQIAQAAHFESCIKANNAQLFAVCDVADDLRDRMVHMFNPVRSYKNYDDMLADNDVDAVIVATADAFHVSASIRALEAGKHVLCEKPAATKLDDIEKLADAVAGSGLIYQIGHMKRYDAGIQAAGNFVKSEMGEMIALKAWYCDSTHRYAMTDAVQPFIWTSDGSKRPSANPKAELKTYYMLAHGSHLLDLARYFAGDIVSVNARLTDKNGIFCWFVDTEFASGALGHLDLTVAVRMDWHEGFQIYGENGSIIGKTFNPWYYKSSEVDIFREQDQTWSRPLGADGHFYRRQLEGFADTILYNTPQTGASIEDGVASVRAMLAVAQSVELGQRVEIDGISGQV